MYTSINTLDRWTAEVSDYIPREQVAANPSPLTSSLETLPRAHAVFTAVQIANQISVEDCWIRQTTEMKSEAQRTEKGRNQALVQQNRVRFPHSYLLKNILLSSKHIVTWDNQQNWPKEIEGNQPYRQTIKGNNKERPFQNSYNIWPQHSHRLSISVLDY